MSDQEDRGPMTSPTDPDQNYPQGGAPQGQPGWSATPPPGYNPQGYNQPGYSPAPSYTGGPAPTGQRPGMVTAAGIIGIVWGALGVLFGLLALSFAFAVGALYGLILLVSVVLSGALLWAGIQVMQGKSPRLLLMISYVAIAINLLSLIVAVAQGGSALGGLLGFVVPGVIIAMLLNVQTKQYYASRGISY
jgi:hypothetical protein